MRNEDVFNWVTRAKGIQSGGGHLEPIMKAGQRMVGAGNSKTLRPNFYSSFDDTPGSATYRWVGVHRMALRGSSPSTVTKNVCCSRNSFPANSNASQRKEPFPDLHKGILKAKGGLTVTALSLCISSAASGPQKLNIIQLLLLNNNWGRNKDDSIKNLWLDILGLTVWPLPTCSVLSLTKSNHTSSYTEPGASQAPPCLPPS